MAFLAHQNSQAVHLSVQESSFKELAAFFCCKKRSKVLVLLVFHYHFLTVYLIVYQNLRQI